MADACYNEVHQREQNALWASQVQHGTADHVYLEEEIETVEGPIHRLNSVDGHEPSPAERKQNDDRLRDLMQNPKARLAAKKSREADEKKFGELLRAMPDVFLYEDQGNHGSLEKLAFHPNPAFAPRTYEETALHAMSGVLLIDLDEKRIAATIASCMPHLRFAMASGWNSGQAIAVILSLRIRLGRILPAILSKCKSLKRRERRRTLLTSTQ
jgi:hypothetical protein